MPAEDATISRVSAAYATVRAAVLDGELPAGSVTSQAAIAERYGLGRTPLREALRLLQREGLVEADHFQRLRIPAFSGADVEELYAQRIVCEALAVRVAVVAMSERERSALRADLDALDALSVPGSYSDWAAVHRRFHDRLVAPAGERLRRSISDLADYAERYRRFYLEHESAGVWEQSRRDHRAIVDAYDARDPARAASEAARHLARTALAIVALVAPEHDPVKLRTALELTGCAPRR